MDTIRWVVVALVTVAALGPAGVGTATAAEDCSFPLTRTDATGESVRVPADPETVVTLSPSAAQTMYEIDAWPEVIGVSAYADYLPDTDEKTVVGTGFGSPTVENTIALDPDLVLAPNTISSSLVSQLRAAGLTVYKFEAAEDLDDIVAKTRLTGELIGSCESADDRADEMERQLRVIEGAVADVERPDVFFSFAPGGYTVGSGTFVHEAIETAGGNNVAADNAGVNDRDAATSGYFPVNAEVVVETDPMWFVLDGGGYDSATVPSGPSGIYEGTPAYQQGNAVVVDPNHISQPAPRIVDAILDLVQAFHPQAYETEIEGRIDEGSLDGERVIAAERRDGGSVDLRVANVGRTDRVSFDLPPRSNATVDVRRVNVTLASVNPTFELHLRDGEGPTAPDGTRALGTIRLSGNGIYDGDIDYLSLRIAVDRNRLDGADPDGVTLYRANDTGWTPLQTTRVNETNATADSLVYEARTTGLSTLLVAAPDPDTAPNASRPTATPAATATASSPTTASSQTPTTATTTSPGTSTPGSAPGFGPLTATAALAVAAAAVGWRR
jgi:putative ABC transporter PGF-CTERM-modified substrate-binding protein